MFGYDTRGSTDRTEAWLQSLKFDTIKGQLSSYGQQGVDALAAATPRDDGTTAASWYYEVVFEKGSWSIIWGNSHMDDAGRTPVAVLIQTGHGTGTGGYVQGIDYINPALRPVFDKISAEIQRVVTQ